MAMHAARGGDIEVMGILQGKVVGRGLVVLDAFALPVEGTETRVNAQAEANEFLIDWLETGAAPGGAGSGHPEHAVGWYHSHPGYGCWLSGVDVATQATQQRWADPFVAVVVDPHRTLAAGRVELGAFRTYPEGYTPPGGDEPGGGARFEAVPLAKAEDFGVHCRAYYPLEVSYFKSAADAALLDALWGRYWAATLAASPLGATRALAAGQTADVAGRLGSVGGELGGGAGLGLVVQAGGGGGGTMAAAATGGDRFGALGRGPAPPGRAAEGEAGGPGGAATSTAAPTRLAAACSAAAKLAAEQTKGAASQVVKALLFNRGLLVKEGGGGGHGHGGGGRGAAGGDAMETA